MQSTVIFVMGHPASGKTTLARAIAQELSFPLYGKDITFKEPMFDEFHTTSREWSLKIGRVAFTIMKAIMQQHLMAGYSFVVESTFKYEFDNPLFAQWQKEYGYRAIQVLCRADAEVLAERFQQRIETGERHDGHGHLDEPFDVKAVRQPIQPFALEGAIIEVGTNTFPPGHGAEVVKRVKQAYNS